MMDSDSGRYTQILAKLQKYCTYQDRCHQEVRNKLLALKVYGDELEQIIGDLIKENFLNEERYARSYVRGKFRMKRWGRNKIKQRLTAKRISDYCIKQGMKEIADTDYLEVLGEIAAEEIQRLSPPINKIALTKKLMQKGYEYSLILQVLENY